MSGHCGYYREVEALIHSAAEVDNKSVIEKGLYGVRGRATRKEILNRIEAKVSKSQLTESSTQLSGTNPVTPQHRGNIQPLP